MKIRSDWDDEEITFSGFAIPKKAKNLGASREKPMTGGVS